MASTPSCDNFVITLPKSAVKSVGFAIAAVGLFKLQ